MAKMSSGRLFKIATEGRKNSGALNANKGSNFERGLDELRGYERKRKQVSLEWIKKE